MKLSKLDPNKKLSELDKTQLKESMNNAVGYVYEYHGQSTDKVEFVTNEVLLFLKKNKHVTAGEFNIVIEQIKKSEIVKLTPKIFMSFMKFNRNPNFLADKQKEYEFKKPLTKEDKLNSMLLRATANWAFSAFNPVDSKYMQEKRVDYHNIIFQSFKNNEDPAMKFQNIHLKDDAESKKERKRILEEVRKLNKKLE